MHPHRTLAPGCCGPHHPMLPRYIAETVYIFNVAFYLSTYFYSADDGHHFVLVLSFFGPFYWRLDTRYTLQSKSVAIPRTAEHWSDRLPLSLANRIWSFGAYCILSHRQTLEMQITFLPKRPGLYFCLVFNTQGNQMKHFPRMNAYGRLSPCLAASEQS